MIKKLDSTQKKALKASIKHWKKDIIQCLEGGYKIIMSQTIADPNLWCDGSVLLIGTAYCALCHEYFSRSCEGCPLGDKPCRSGGAPYNDFYNKPTLTNARKMVKTMEKVLKERG